MEVKLTNFEYEPGGKWDCGVLNFDAETPLGLVTWREVVPGPRHGDDAAERAGRCWLLVPPDRQDVLFADLLRRSPAARVLS